jgi:hypothetical protein
MLQNVDMIVAPQLRRRGVYSRLSQLAGSRRKDLMFGIPNENSRSEAKGEMDVILPLDVWKFPVQISMLIEKKPYRFIAPIADALSRIYAFLWHGQRPDDLIMRQIERFERDFDVDPEIIHGVRSADYLNWRFFDNPLGTYSVFEFFENEQNIGYCIYETVDSKAVILDFVTDSRQRGCLRLLVEHCREMGISHLSFGGIGLKLGRFGFIRRGTPATCVLSNTRYGLRVPQGDWLITLADKD